ncbi:hypothetical protein P167DRAFT_533540 [Morchella conica CCBAS932]|uniref:Uncharacterized protein n=1 Tax=Morchella conica CCBAS932 TaxID=1392247 RepID=A0A3N4LAB6_9PEZI|nr:hypothetical protein P167DRAFT_533540 [Morchella conica CCBAS932]
MENLATLYLVDNRGNTKGRGMICPLEHIDTYEKLASTLTLLFPEDAARAGDLKFQVMTNDRLVIHQQFWDEVAAVCTPKVFYCDFNEPEKISC